MYVICFSEITKIQFGYDKPEDGLWDVNMVIKLSVNFLIPVDPRVLIQRLIKLIS